MDEKVVELQSLVKELREKFEQKEQGLYTKAEFEEFEKKINERIAQLETMIKRPVVADSVAENSENKSVFFKFLREGKAGLEPTERKKLVEDTAGQILVPEELEAEVYRELPRISVIRGLATVRQVRSDRIRSRSLTEVQVGWGKLETSTTPLAEPSSYLLPSDEYHYVEDLYGLVKIGEDELMDTDVALESLIVDSFARAIAEAEDRAFVIGAGHDSQEPQGILTSADVQKIDGTVVKGITTDDILSLIYAVPAQYRRNGVLLVNSQTELALRLLKDTNDQYLWQPSLQAGRPNTFAGFPVYNQEDIPSIPTGTTAADVAIFGDLRSGYRILDRLGITIQRLTELYAESGLVGFRAHYRVGGGIIRPNALRVLHIKVV
jgi:HK97 family phage major capsid protein